MAIEKINVPCVKLIDFLNQHTLYKSKRVEILGAFAHWMENVKKISQDTEKNFEAYLEEFKNQKV